jgi:hypothetical protein
MLTIEKPEFRIGARAAPEVVRELMADPHVVDATTVDDACDGVIRLLKLDDKVRTLFVFRRSGQGFVLSDRAVALGHSAQTPAMCF